MFFTIYFFERTSGGEVSSIVLSSGRGKMIRTKTVSVDNTEYITYNRSAVIIGIIFIFITVIFWIFDLLIKSLL